MRKLLAILICLAGFGAVLRADSMPVTAVRVERLGRAPFDESSILSRVSVRTGDEFDRAAVARDVRALLDTGHFADVSARADEAADGVALVYQVRPKLRIGEAVTVKGVHELGEGAVREALDLWVGDVVDDGLLGERAAKVVELYRKYQYPSARVDWDIRPLDEAAGTAAVEVRVREGSRARIRSVEFDGNEALKDRVLRQAIKIRSPRNPLSLLFPSPYDPAELDMGLEDIRRAYLDRGYLDMRPGDPAVSPPRGGWVTIVVPIREGLRYRIGSISFEGASLFGEGPLRAALKVRAGEPVSMSAVDLSASEIRDYYGARGYIRTRVEPALTPRPGGTVDLKFVVSEGALTRIGRIEIEGNSRTRDKVIRRELQVAPGELFDEVRVRRSERRLANLGFFENVSAEPQDTADPAVSDLLVSVEEGRTGQFMIGAGFSSVDDLIGYTEISQGNFDIAGWPHFTGGGQKLKLGAKAGTKMDEYSLSFVEPWFLDRRLSLSADLYTGRRSYSDYDVQRQGGSVGLGFPLPGPNRFDVQYRLERVDISDVDDPALYTDVDGSTFTFNEEGADVQSSMSFGLAQDTRDSVFVPTRGRRLKAGTSVSGGPLGFDTDIYGFDLRAEQHIPLWFGHVLSLRAGAETVDAYGSTDEVPLVNRLFAGGPRTIRGFRYRDVGPKAYKETTLEDGTVVRSSYRPRGGQSLSTASAEYTVTVVPKVRVAGFYDIGSLAVDAYDFGFDPYAWGTGIGLRLDMPGFPIRIDYALDVGKDDPMTRVDRWSFWIGYGF